MLVKTIALVVDSNQPNVKNLDSKGNFENIFSYVLRENIKLNKKKSFLRSSKEKIFMALYNSVGRRKSKLFNAPKKLFLSYFEFDFTCENLRTSFV